MLSQPRVTEIRRSSTPLAMELESLNPILELTVSPTTQIVETGMPPPSLRLNRPHDEKADASPDNIVRFIVCADYNHSLMDNPHA